MWLDNISPFFRRKADDRTGFVYFSGRDTDPMRHAKPGRIIRVEGRGPPWIVVDESVVGVVVAKWPGKLWKVAIIEAATHSDQRATGGPPRVDAGYTRAISVKVLSEENPALLFGDHGQSVLTVLDRAGNLTRLEAQQLSALRHAEAPAAYDRTFRRWAQVEGIPVDHYDNLDHTLLMGSKRIGSPIYGGLGVVHHMVFERAEMIDGKAATVVIDDEDVYLVEPWRGVSAVFCDAALALGAPEFVSDSDREILLSAWQQM